MEIIESIAAKKSLKFTAKQSLIDRLDSVKKEAKKRKVVFNFSEMMEAYAEKLIGQAEDKLKA